MDEIIKKKQENNQAYIWQAQLDELKEKKLLAKKGFRKEEDMYERNETFRHNNYSNNNQRKYDQHGYRIESNSNEVGDDDNDNNIDDANMDNEYEYMDPGNLDIGYEVYNKLEGSNVIL
jgi:hypothetical protein